MDKAGRAVAGAAAVDGTGLIGALLADVAVGPLLLVFLPLFCGRHGPGVQDTQVGELQTKRLLGTPVDQDAVTPLAGVKVDHDASLAVVACRAHQPVDLDRVALRRWRRCSLILLEVSIAIKLRGHFFRVERTLRYLLAQIRGVLATIGIAYILGS